MNIDDLYQTFIETEHKDSALADHAVESADNKQSVTDGIEEELHKGFVSGFIAGIDFMKGALR